MAASVYENDVILRLAQHLGLPAPFTYRDNGQTGPDIIVELDGKKYFIEAISYTKQSGRNQMNFWKAFAQATARLNPDSKWGKADRVVIALPHQFLDGWQLRVSEHGKSVWSRIGVAYPELEIWFVSEEAIHRYSWNDAYAAKL